MTDARPTADFVAITLRQQAVWAAGNFNALAPQVMPMAERLVAAADPRPGQRVLDIACGSGNAALVAARRYCEVTGLDFVPALLEHARRRATADGLALELVEGDAQSLPFADESFDIALSVLGVMFAPYQQRAADEAVRVVRPGGRIALASWRPDGSVGDFFALVASYAPPPGGVPSPLRWGTEEGVKELFGDRTRVRALDRATLDEHYLSVEHAVEVFSTEFGPVLRTLAMIGDAERAKLRADLTAMFTGVNAAKDGTFTWPCEYLQVVLERR
jgi:SAM-dependent methyltransferase